MKKGYIRIKVATASGTIPISSAKVVIKNLKGDVLNTVYTDLNGITSEISLRSKDTSLSLEPNSDVVPYVSYNVHVTAHGFRKKNIKKIQIFGGIHSTLPVDLYPSSSSFSDIPTDISDLIEVGQNTLFNNEPRDKQDDYDSTGVLKNVIIPDKITVHLGKYDLNATNVTIPFIDYIKNVASSEIYPTWPVNAIVANIHAQISFALNRVYTEWYHAQGYDFHITSLPANDQAYNHGRDIFDNVARIVEDIFNVYIRREGHKEPYVSQFCNGTTSTCAGLSQWGTVTLANKGYNPINILKYYYPDDIQLIKSYNIEAIGHSFSGLLLREGSQGEDVVILKKQLNRITTDFPGIPGISNSTDLFDSSTTKSVKVFQSVFSLLVDGLVGIATWNQVSRVYTAITKLSELDAEGEIVGIGTTPPTSVIKYNSIGRDVLKLQHCLNFISMYRVEIPPVLENSNFDMKTNESVISFQKTYKLISDGIVGPTTWNKLYSVYAYLKDSVDIPAPDVPDALYPPYPDVLLKVGSRGPDVEAMQKLLFDISKFYVNIPTLSADGIFGLGTKNSVVAFQTIFALSADGIIGRATWNKIIYVHQKAGTAEPSLPYPNTLLKVGSRGSNVVTIQENLNVVSTVYTKIKKTIPDGIFGNATKDSVIAFQNKFALVSDGIVGKMTWDKIISESFLIQYNSPTNQSIDNEIYNSRTNNSNRASLSFIKTLLFKNMNSK